MASVVKQTSFQLFSVEEKAMSYDPSLTVGSHKPALLPGMRRFSNRLMGVLAALAWCLSHSAQVPWPPMGLTLGSGAASVF